SVRASLDAPEIGPVIHIVTPRAKPGGNVTEVRTEPWGRRKFESWVAFEAKAASICRFNSEAAKLDATSNSQQRLNTSLAHLFDDAEEAVGRGSKPAG